MRRPPLSSGPPERPGSRGSRPRPDPRDESGQTLVLAMIVLAVSLLLVAAVTTFVIFGLRTSLSDADREASMHAADSGIDLALWRTNKLLVSDGISSLLGLVNGVVQTVSCADVDAGTGAVRIVPQGNAGQLTSTTQTSTTTGTGVFCPGVVEQSADKQTARYEYWESTAINLLQGTPTVTETYPTSGVATLNRMVVSVGDVAGRTTRLLAILTDCLGGQSPASAAGQCQSTGGASTYSSPTSIWTETFYAQCPAPPADWATSSTFAQEPDAGCPSAAAPATPAGW